MATNINQDQDKDQEHEEVKLWVKLKIRDSDNRVIGFEKNKEDYDSNKKNILPSPRVCRICGKSFGSGKALGGHMRIHFQKKTIFNDDDDCHRVANKEPIICLLCRKVFRSMKSLYGHMRCHPGRDWRGIKPPGGGGGGAVDLKESLTGWQVTARRGRKPRFESVDKHDREAVHYLMMLAHGNYYRSPKVGLGSIGKFVGCGDVSNDQELEKGRSNNLEFDLNELPPTEGEAGSSLKGCV